MRKVLPDGTEEWYQGGRKQTTISVLGSDWFSCYYYRLTVRPCGDGYRLVAVELSFWDAANLEMHAEWHFDTPAQFHLQSLEKLNLP